VPEAQDPEDASTLSFSAAAAALRLGWAVAETRGRFDPQGDQIARPLPAPTLVLDAAHERSRTESQIEVAKVLAALGRVEVAAIDLDRLTGSEEWGPIPATPAGRTAMTGASDYLGFLASRIVWSQERKDVSATLDTFPLVPDERRDLDGYWKRMQWFLWAWDEALQDQLAAGDFGTASAYQLGRGLAETYWALDPRNAEDLSQRWTFLLGENRVQALTTLAQRLAPSLKTYVAAAIEDSVQAWGDVAKSPSNYVNPVDALERQVRIWRDLLVTSRDPMTLVTAARFEEVARDPRPIIKAYKWEVGGVGIAGVLLGLGATYLSSAPRAIVSALAAFGISATTLLGWVKARVQSVSARVSDAVNQSVVNEAVRLTPDPVEAQKRPRFSVGIVGRKRHQSSGSKEGNE
jgi:hypothetical protein